MTGSSTNADVPSCPVCGGGGKVTWRKTGEEMRHWMAEILPTAPPATVEIADYRMARCGACTLEYADPLVAGSDSFYEWIVRQDWYFPEDRWEWPVAIERIRQKGLRTVVEVGCGSGIFLERLREAGGGVRGIGVDLTPGAVAQCRARGLEVYHGLVEDFGALTGEPQGTVDCAAAFHCLEHVADPVGFVSAMARLVGAGGIVLVSTPYSPMYYERRWPDPLNHPPHHMTRWNRASYARLGERLGMTVRFHMPPGPSVFTRVSQSVALWDRPVLSKRGRAARLLKAALHPVELVREALHQRRRDVVDGFPAANVVMVEFEKKRASEQ